MERSRGGGVGDLCGVRHGRGRGCGVGSMAGVGDLKRGFDARQAAIDGHESVKDGIELGVREPVIASHDRVVPALSSACAVCSKRRRYYRSLPVAG